ncbi:MAG TPA: hypothetical protein VK492_01555 [Chitinophagaceae bacterium]|nr:hypothetical protein [Chitinophagaceae bacterium]
MLNNIFSWLVIAFLTAWLLISIFNQHRKWRRIFSAVTNRDIFSLVPLWTFFAPNPGRTDLYLLYRDRDSDGTISNWREIRSSFRNTWFVQWSPLRRIQKGIVDLAPNFTIDKIVELKQPVTKRHVLGFPYLLLLNYVCSKPADFSAEMRQFAIARTDGHGTEDSPDVIFLSAFHKIENIN